MGRVGPPVPASFPRGSSNRLTLTNGRLHGCTVEGRNRSFSTHSRGHRCHPVPAAVALRRIRTRLSAALEPPSLPGSGRLGSLISPGGEFGLTPCLGIGYHPCHMGCMTRKDPPVRRIGTGVSCSTLIAILPFAVMLVGPSGASASVATATRASGSFCNDANQLENWAAQDEQPGPDQYNLHSDPYILKNASTYLEKLATEAPPTIQPALLEWANFTRALAPDPTNPALANQLQPATAAANQVEKWVATDSGCEQATTSFLKSPWFILYLFIAWWLGFVGIMASLWQPSAAYRATGRSKLRWVVIELVGFALGLGLITWFAFRFFVRESLKENGGQKGFWQDTPEEKAAKAAKRAEQAKRAANESRERNESTASGRASNTRQRWEPTHNEWDPKEREVDCSNCSGGKTTCTRCGGRGLIENAAELRGTGNDYRSCDNYLCQGGRVDCSSCNGTGKKSVYG
jgi:hypothetical protein